MPILTRKQVAAGRFYPEEPAELRKVLIKLFKSGVGKEPYIKRDKDYLKGLIVPHAGYIFSGSCASYAYYELSKHEPRTFIIIGPNHSGMGIESISVMHNAEWETPLGKTLINRDAASRIIESLRLTPDFMAHMNEHSIEVQLPFLQLLYGDSLKIVPIVISDASLEELKRLGNELSKINATIIASSDFTHHGQAYNYHPFKNVKTDMYDYDMKAIKLIQELKVDEFHSLGEQSTICGYKPITALMQSMKALRAKPGFLNYSTSAGVTGDYDNVVGYASMVFK